MKNYIISKSQYRLLIEKKKNKKKLLDVLNENKENINPLLSETYYTNKIIDFKNKGLL
jgi:PHD/YefM family antitoxin component YafN of YafNO toxin-antitoxin module